MITGAAAALAHRRRRRTRRREGSRGRAEVPNVRSPHPVLLRGQVMAVIGHLGLLSGVGRGGRRAKRLQNAWPPTLAPDAVLGEGHAGRAFIV